MKLIGEKMRMRWWFIALISITCCVAAAERPNIVIIMVDDMGFSDIGCYGGEIKTPNIDALAKGGVRFTQFYNTGRCCPTRASLMTGLHPHQAGVGHMTETPQRESKMKGPYQGYLNQKCVTIAEALQEADYQTMMVGKWHLGYHGKERWPTRRGFEKFYGIHAGAAHYFKPSGARGLTLQENSVEPVSTRKGERYYMTDAFTDYACNFVDEVKEKKGKPFFMYLAYNAPHWPLHAKEKDIKKYLGKTYTKGFEKISTARLKRMQAMGLIDPSFTPAPHEGPGWEKLNEKKRKLLDLYMSTYAACIDSIDQNIGKFVETLKKNGQYENTVIFFLSDNGACAEGGVMGQGKWEQFFDPEADTYHTLRYGRVWANVSSTPFRLYKHFNHEGGIATPLIVHWPAGLSPKQHNELIKPYGYLPDLMPTCLELAKAKYPKVYKGNAITPMQGKSLLSAIKGETTERDDPIFFEHEGNGALRQGKWKLVHRGKKPWELYDMSKDRTEMHDLAKKHPQKLNEMIATWESKATSMGVRFPQKRK